MRHGKLFWDQRNYPAVELLFRKSIDFCKDVTVWNLNVAHTLFMQGTKYKEAITFYEKILSFSSGDVSKMSEVKRLIFERMKKRTLLTFWIMDLFQHSLTYY